MNTRDQNFIETAIEKNNIAAIIDKADSSEIKYPVAIVSYKNRYDRVFKHLEEHCVPFMVFVYADDFVPSGYNKYHFKYGKFVHITKEDFAKYDFHEKSIQRKRYFLQKYMENTGIDKYFLLDDDFYPYGYYPVCTGVEIEGKRKTLISELKTIDLVTCLKVIQFAADAYDIDLCGPTDKYRLKGFTYMEPFYVGNLYSLFLINGKALKQAKVEFDPQTIFEDTDISIHTALSGLKVGKIEFLTMEFNVMASTIRSVVPARRDELSFNLYRKNPWCIVPTIVYSKKHKTYVLNHIIKEKRFLETDYPYDKALHEKSLGMTWQEFRKYLGSLKGIDVDKPKETV